MVRLLVINTVNGVDLYNISNVIFALFLIAPSHLFKLYKNVIIESRHTESNMKDLFFGVFVLACLSMWFLMIDLNQTPNPFTLP